MSYANKPDEPGKSTGNLFVNDFKEASNQPDWTGYLNVSREQITDLIEKGKRGEEVKFKLSSWTYPSKKDANQSRYFIVADSKDFKKSEKPADNDWSDAEDDVPF
jgi:hypothetical protein